MEGEGQEQSGPDLDRLRTNFDAERANLARWRAFVMIVAPVLMLGFLLPYCLLRYDEGRLEAWAELRVAHDRIHTRYVEPLIDVRVSLQTWIALHLVHTDDEWEIEDAAPTGQEPAHQAAAEAGGASGKLTAAVALVRRGPVDDNLRSNIAGWCDVNTTTDAISCLTNGNGLIRASLNGYRLHEGSFLIVDVVQEARCAAISADLPAPATIETVTRELLVTLRRARGHLVQILADETASPPLEDRRQHLRARVRADLMVAIDLEDCIGSIRDAVERYLNGGPDVSEENRERVKAQYQELEGSFEGFQSPFGSFPIDARYIILLFPIVYATSARAFGSSQRRLGIVFRSYREAAAAAGKLPEDGNVRCTYALMPALPVLHQRKDGIPSLAIWMGPILLWFALALWLSLWDSFVLRSWDYADTHDSVMAILFAVVDLLAALFIYRTYCALKASMADFCLAGVAGSRPADPEPPESTVTHHA